MPFVQVVDVDENFKLKPDTKQHISETVKGKSVFVTKGSVVVTLQGSIGRVAITQYDSYVDRTLLVFQNLLIPIDDIYFSHFLYMLFDYEKNRTHGETIKTIPINKLNQFYISFPSFEKQKKIGTLLSSLNELITLNQ